MNSSDLEQPPPLCDFAARIMAQRLKRMLSHAEGARLGEQSEPIHQMRVWSRRARAAHDLFSICFPGEEYRLLGRELKAVTDALGEARDLDVMIEALQKRARALPMAQRAGIEGFIEDLKSQRKDRQKAVTKAIHRLEDRQVRQRFVDMLGEFGVELDPEPSHKTSVERIGNG